MVGYSDRRDFCSFVPLVKVARGQGLCAAKEGTAIAVPAIT